MKYKIIVLLLLFPLCSRGQSSKNLSVLQDELRRFDAMIRRDTAALALWLSEELVYRHSNGLLEDKRRHLEAIASGALVYEQLVRDSAQVRCYGRTALVNGIARVRGCLQQTPFDLRLSYLAVYRKRSGRWQLIRWQSTRLP
ncbi:MAG: nuclear transport factor 2 family protein [Saprospiraceae bacterium]|nr:nuclear transport factor 2 family protein [Saprospiraceae bacterium]MDW8484887.1 nuclear transport factor 2 family protein [Saprospiraceae bacterium]